MLGMTVGLPLSGKSTWIDTLHDWQIVCPDDIRLAFGHEFFGPLEPVVWATAETMVRAHLMRGKRVLVDATNITAKERGRWKRMADEFNVPAVAFVGFASQWTCVKRANFDGRQHMIPVIKRMADKHEIAQPREEGITILPAYSMSDEERKEYAQST